MRELKISQWIGWIRDWRRALPLYVYLLALALWAPNLWGPLDNLYDVRSDSSKYHAAAEGYALWLEELPSALGKMVSGEFGDEDAQRYGFDTGIIQHATTYVVGLGTAYSIFGAGHHVGRIFTLLLAAGVAALLVAWTRRAFGVGPALISGGLFLLWPIHPYFATAIMTEMPMAFLLWLAFWSLDRSREHRSVPGAFFGGVALGWLALAKISLRAIVVPLLLLDLFWVWRSVASRTVLPEQSAEAVAGAKGTRRGAPKSESSTNRKSRRDRRRGVRNPQGLAPARFAFWRVAGLGLIGLAWLGFLQATSLPLDPDGTRGRLLWTYRGTYVPDRGFETVGLGDAITGALTAGVRKADPLPKEEKEAVIYAEALRQVIARDPTGWLGLVAAKAGWFWRFPGAGTDIRTWMGSWPPPVRFQSIVLFFALLGLVVAGLRDRTRWLPAIAGLGLTFVHAFTHMVSRYSIPALPLALAYSGLGIYVIANGLLGMLGWWGRPGRKHAQDRSEKSGRLGRFFVDPRVRVSLTLTIVAWALAIWLVRDVWVGWGVAPATAFGFQTMLGSIAFLCTAVTLFLLYRALGAGRWGSLLLLAVLPGFLAVTWWGERESDRDPDRWSADLSVPGDRAVQEITLPTDLEWRAVKRNEIVLDLLPSLRGETDLIVRVNGTEVASFSGHPRNPDENFETSEYVHAVQKRYRRVREALESYHEDFVQPRHPEIGMGYFRQWYRIPVNAELIRAQNPVRIEVELAATRGGGSVRLYGDQIITEGEKGRVTLVPTFIENPYYLSTYQFVFFSTDRERADYRLTEPIKIFSRQSRSEFFRKGQTFGVDLSPARGRQTGEYRIRLRSSLRGQYVHRASGNDKTRPLWAVWPGADDDRLSNDELRRFASNRERFLTGWRVY